jgi:SAM-dependent methyltransferase
MNDEVKKQYATPRHLATRGSFLGKYGTIDWFRWVFDLMAIPESSDVLDVGCGPAGIWLAQADRLPKTFRLMLIDASAGMIAEAKANFSGNSDRCGAAELCVGGATSLPFADASFDVVLLVHVLYHGEDRHRAFDEVRHVLRPGGRVFVSTNLRNNMAELHMIAARALGGEAVDPGAARFSLDDAEREMGALFVDVRRHDLTDIMTCTDPADAIAFLLSCRRATSRRPSSASVSLRPCMRRSFGAGEASP